MIKNLLFSAPEALVMRVPMSLTGWSVEPFFVPRVAETDVDSGSSSRGKPRFWTMELDQNASQAPHLDNLRKTASCCGSAAAAQPLAIQYYYSDNCPWDRECTILQFHCYNGFATGETRVHGPLGLSPCGLRSEVNSLMAGGYRIVSTHVEEGPTHPMSFTRPYTPKERFKKEQRERRSQPDYDPRIECFNHWQDKMEYDDLVEKEERDLRRRGMAPDFAWGSNHLRMAKAIRMNVNQGIEAGGREHAVFITFTFGHIPNGVSPFEYANDSFERARKTFLPTHFKHCCRVMDFDEGGKLHFHGIAITHLPVFDGFDPEGYDAYMEASRSKLKIKALRRIRSTVSTNANLRAIWSALDANIERFGFGPMHGVFPIRHFPGKSGGDFRTRVAEYMVRAYYRAVPAIKRRTDKKVRAYQSSAKYPSKVRAADIESPWWKHSIKPLMDIFGFEQPKQFGDLLGPRWGLAILNLVDGLDSVTGRNVLNQGWREFPVKDKAWLAIRLMHMIEHDQFLHDQASGLLPDLQECAESYQPHPDEPTRWGWVPLIPRECTCCPGPNLVNTTVVQSIMAVPN